MAEDKSEETCIAGEEFKEQTASGFKQVCISDSGEEFKRWLIASLVASRWCRCSQ